MNQKLFYSECNALTHKEFPWGENLQNNPFFCFLTKIRPRGWPSPSQYAVFLTGIVLNSNLGIFNYCFIILPAIFKTWNSLIMMPVFFWFFLIMWKWTWPKLCFTIPTILNFLNYSAMVPCLRLTWITFSSDHWGVWTANLNFEPSLKLWSCHAQDLLGLQIPVITGGFELLNSCIQSSYLMAFQLTSIASVIP